MHLKQLACAVFLSTALVGCGQSNTQNSAANQEATTANSTQTHTYESRAGEITLPATVNRIAVLDTNSLNTIHALGADDKVVAVTKGTPLPSYLKSFADPKYADVGTAKEANLERVAATQPELILMSGRMENLLDQIKQIAPTYFVNVDYANLMDSFKTEVRAIAQMVEKTDEAERQLTKLDSDIAALKERTQGKTALVVMVNNNRLAAYGEGSRFAHIYDLYGFSPVDPSIRVNLHGMSVSPEFIAQKNPDYLFVIDRGAAITEQQYNARQVLNNAIINGTKAAQNGTIVYLNSANWYLMNNGLGGMQSMVDEVSQSIKD